MQGEAGSCYDPAAISILEDSIQGSSGNEQMGYSVGRTGGIPDGRRGRGLQAHHAVAGVYDLNKEVVLEGRLKKLNFTNPHASIELDVPDKKTKKITTWVLTTASTSRPDPAGGQQDVHEAWRAPQGHDPSGAERQSGGIHQESPARRQEHSALLRRRQRLTRHPGSWQWLIDDLSRQVCSLFLSR